jgi:transposase
VHVTETCDDDEPHLIIHTETTAATTPDWGMADPIHHALEHQGCLPSRQVVDGGYVDAEAIVTRRSKYDVELFGPVPLENSWQAKAAGGFDLAHAPFRLAEPDPYLPRWTTQPYRDAH